MNEVGMDYLLGSDGDEGGSKRSQNRKRGRRGRRRRRRHNRGGFLAPMLAIIVLVGVLGGGGYYGFHWVRNAMTPDDYTGQGTGEVLIEVREGASAAEVAQTLEQKDVVASARAFTNAIDAAGKSASLHPGDYKLRKQMAAKYAVDYLVDPDKRLRTTVTIREGLRLAEVYKDLSAKTGFSVKEFEQAAKSLDLPREARGKLEGYAFPATYEISPKMTPSQILNAMVDRFDQAAEETDIAAGARELGFTRHEMLTIASIIQAESGSTADMPKVARVIYNRLQHKPPMKLEMDSTTLYANNRYGIMADAAALKNPSPYNTYMHPGLPPGPIDSPGEHAIEAALNPAKGNWLFFVTTDPKAGITKFTDRHDQHELFVAELNRNCAAGRCP